MRVDVDHRAGAANTSVTQRIPPPSRLRQEEFACGTTRCAVHRRVRSFALQGISGHATTKLRAALSPGFRRMPA